jgi:hypothetical protein
MLTMVAANAAANAANAAASISRACLNHGK